MSVVRNQDGRLELFGRGFEGALDHIYQKDAGGEWGQWMSLGGNIIAAPAAAHNKDGRLEVFGIGDDRSLRHIWQTQANGDWSTWDSLGGQLEAGPQVFANADGTLDVFAITADSALWHIQQSAPSNGWLQWESLGGSGNVWPDGNNIAAYQNQDGRLDVFVIFEDRTLRHIWQSSPGGNWNKDWNSPQNNLGGNLIGPPAVGRNQDGRLEVFAFAADRKLWHRWQKSPGDDWEDWKSTEQVLLASVPHIVRNADGRMEIFASAEDGNLWHMWQTAPNAAFTSWNSLGGAVAWGGQLQYLLGLISVGSNSDGRIEVFGSSNVKHRWQTAPNNGWSDWGTVPAGSEDDLGSWREWLGRGFIEF